MKTLYNHDNNISIYLIKIAQSQITTITEISRNSLNLDLISRLSDFTKPIRRDLFLSSKAEIPRLVRKKITKISRTPTIMKNYHTVHYKASQRQKSCPTYDCQRLTTCR